MAATIAHIYRYPVKGLSAAPLDRVALTAGRGMAHDRRFALANAATRFDGAPHWLPRRNFLMLARNPLLAALVTDFEAESEALTVARDGQVVARGKVTEPAGRAVLEEFFAAYLGDEAPERPRLVEAAGQPFSDMPEPFLSIINLASLEALAAKVGAAIDPLRFRGNLYVGGAEPWAEFDWVGREMEAGGVRLRIVEPIERCVATNVNPDSGVRDMNLPKALGDGFGHVDMGVYAQVSAAGEIAVGDPLRAPG